MTIQRDSYSASKDPKPTRRETRDMADWLGIDTSGFTTREMREAVDTELRKQAKAKEAVDDINEFARRKSDKNDAVNRGADPPAAPQVINTVIETREVSLPEPRNSPSDGPTVQGEGVATGGAFCTLITDGGGDIYLQGGTINGLSVANILLFDALPTPTWSAAEGYFLWVPITGAFVVVDGVALPGFTATSAGTPFWATSATDSYPAVTGATSASSGVCNVNLGVMGDATFYPSGCGNRVVDLCITPPYTGDV